MIKQIKRWGNSLIISFTPKEREAEEMNEGDYFDVELCKLKKGGNKNGDKLR